VAYCYDSAFFECVKDSAFILVFAVFTIPSRLIILLNIGGELDLQVMKVRLVADMEFVVHDKVVQLFALWVNVIYSHCILDFGSLAARRTEFAVFDMV
jgi:hypothetical protein